MGNTILDRAGVSVGSTPDWQLNTLLSIILDAAMQLSRCRAGTIYSRAGETLCFRLVRNLDMPELEQAADAFPPVPMGSRANLCTLAAAEGKTLHIPDAYAPTSYDLSGLHSYDNRTGYRSHSVLVCPIMYRADCMAVLQLINARSADGAECDFTQTLPLVEKLAESVADALPIFRLLSERGRLMPKETISEGLRHYLEENDYGALSPRELRDAASQGLISTHTMESKLASMEADKQELIYSAGTFGGIRLSYELPAELLIKPPSPSTVLSKCIRLSEKLHNNRFSPMDANIDKSTFSRLKNGKMKMDPKYLFAILIALKLPPEQTTELLNAYGIYFSPCVWRDRIIKYFLLYAENRATISVTDVNIELDKLGLELLGSQVLENDR